LGVLVANFVVLGSLAGVRRMSAKDLRLQRRLKAKKARDFKKRVAALAIVVSLIVVLVSVYSFRGGAPNASNSVVLLVTSMGNITIELYGDMPITAGNFRNLVNRGVYDGTIFHRVTAGVIQGGDPTTAGYGGPVIPTISDELPNKHHNVHGAVAMAKTDQPDSASDQFFINLRDNSAAPANYDIDYSVFGQVIDGLTVVDAIGKVPLQGERPVQNVTLIRAQLIG
jgi:peptidylprolyl isomerase